MAIAYSFKSHDISNTQNAVEIVRMLLESGADPNVVISNGRTCLIKLVAREPKYYNEYHSDIARLLVEHEADISVADSNGMTAYDYAVKFGRTELYELLKPWKIFPRKTAGEWADFSAGTEM